MSVGQLRRRLKILCLSSLRQRLLFSPLPSTRVTSAASMVQPFDLCVLRVTPASAHAYSLVLPAFASIEGPTMDSRQTHFGLPIKCSLLYMS